MTPLDLPETHAGDFVGTATHAGRKITLRLSGNADLRAGEALDSLIQKLDAEAQRLVVAEVAVDLRELEFMNSSCFKSFVTWIGALQELDPGKQYRIRFLSNSRMHWQRRSLHALKCFAADLIDVEP